jgi:hypothetical protein
MDVGTPVSIAEPMITCPIIGLRLIGTLVAVILIILFDTVTKLGSFKKVHSNIGPLFYS